MDLVDLCITADDYDIDYKGKTKQQLIYLILDEQAKQTQPVINNPHVAIAAGIALISICNAVLNNENNDD